MVELQSLHANSYKWNGTEPPILPGFGRVPGSIDDWKHQINALARINFTELPQVESASSSFEDYDEYDSGGSDYDGYRQQQARPVSYRRSKRPKAKVRQPKRANKAAGKKGSKFGKGNAVWLNSHVDIPKFRKNRGRKLAPYKRRQLVGRRRRAGLRPVPQPAVREADDRKDHGGSAVGKSGGLSSIFSKPLFSRKSKDKGKGETIWLESTVKFPGSSSSSSSGGLAYIPKKRRGPSSSSSSSSSGPKIPSSSSSSGGTPVLLPKKKSKGSFHCSIGRREKGDDAALITLGSIGIPLAVVATLFGGSLGGTALSNLVTSVSTGIQDIITAITGGRRSSRNVPETPAATTSRALTLWSPLIWPAVLRKVLRFDWKSYRAFGRSLHNSFSLIMWKIATSGLARSGDQCVPKVARDLGSDMEFIDENEIVLRMLDDLMMTYKYGYVPKCTRSHICKLNKAAASGGQPQSTIVPLMSLPAAWLLGKPSSNVMDFLHAVWLGRNEKDCDEVYPECSDIYSSLRFRGGGANSTDTELEADLHMDELLNDLRYLEENNQMAPAAETNQDRKEDDPKEEKTT